VSWHCQVMSDEELHAFPTQLGSVGALRKVEDAESLLRAAGAGEILGVLQRLGFWVGGGRNPASPVRQFSPDISRLESGRLGDETGYWQSELSRVTAILGALDGQERLLKSRTKRARDVAAATILRSAKDAEEKAPTSAQLSVQVSERPEVVELEEQVALLEAVAVTLAAARDAIEGYCRVLSRELTRRGDLLRAGMG
jgi:hypothetical protein